MTAPEIDPPQWGNYWENHPQLMLWHSQRYIRITKEVTVSNDLACLNLQNSCCFFIVSRQPHKATIWTLAKRLLKTKRMMLWFQFSIQQGKISVIYTSSNDAKMVFSETQKFLSSNNTGLCNAPVKLNPHVLTVKGKFVATLKGYDQKHLVNLFHVFGPHTFYFESDFCFRVRYDNQHDAEHALKSLQYWLLMDWGLMIGYAAKDEGTNGIPAPSYDSVSGDARNGGGGGGGGGVGYVGNAAISDGVIVEPAPRPAVTYASMDAKKRERSPPRSVLDEPMPPLPPRPQYAAPLYAGMSPTSSSPVNVLPSPTRAAPVYATTHIPAGVQYASVAPVPSLAPKPTGGPIPVASVQRLQPVATSGTIRPTSGLIPTSGSRPAAAPPALPRTPTPASAPAPQPSLAHPQFGVRRRCPHDGNCPDVNTPVHQSVYYHTCTMPKPCPWLDNPLHTSCFEHK
jgi:hypothetical protein